MEYNQIIDILASGNRDFFIGLLTNHPSLPEVERGFYMKRPAWNKGMKMSEEFCKKLSKSQKGHIVSLETRKKISDYNKRVGKKPPTHDGMLGKHHTEKTKEIIRAKNKGKRYGVFTEEGRKKLSIYHSGDKCIFWKGGITKLRAKIYNSYEYKEWRKNVFIRDEYTCVLCKVKNGNGKEIYLQADHIKPFSLFPELRFNIDNGQTLCKNCHNKKTVEQMKIYWSNQYFKNRQLTLI